MDVVADVLICFENLLYETYCEEKETNHFAPISGVYEILLFVVAIQIFIYLPLFLVSLSCAGCLLQAHMATREPNPS